MSVLVLEAGNAPPKVTDIPVAARSFMGTDLDWNFKTAPQQNAALQQIDNVFHFSFLFPYLLVYILLNCFKFKGNVSLTTSIGFL